MIVLCRTDLTPSQRDRILAAVRACGAEPHLRDHDGRTFLAAAREETGLPVVTEVLDTRDVALVERHADMLQVGSRSMHNFALLTEVGRTRKPVLLKRGMSATIDELLTSAEYVLAEGNDQVVLCERGIRTFEHGSRNTLDLT